jgi:hypothetical protein
MEIFTSPVSIIPWHVFCPYTCRFVDDDDAHLIGKVHDFIGVRVVRRTVTVGADPLKQYQCKFELLNRPHAFCPTAATRYLYVCKGQFDCTGNVFVCFQFPKFLTMLKFIKVAFFSIQSLPLAKWCGGYRICLWNRRSGFENHLDKRFYIQIRDCYVNCNSVLT